MVTMMTTKYFGFTVLYLCAMALSLAVAPQANANSPAVIKENLLNEAEAEVIIANNTLDLPAVSPKTSNTFHDNTHPVLKITPDKSEMITLADEAASVIVGNPNHISVLLDTPTTLVVVPRNIGASHFSVIGKNGDVLMQRHVIVGVAPTASDEQYVRIRRSCAADDRDCQPTSVYFCPDMCHEVQENTQGRR